MLVADKAEFDQLVKSVAGVAEPAYLVLGSLATQVYRRGLSGGVSLQEINAHMADFKSYWNVDVTPAGWSQIHTLG